ncbi:hypothetical protein MNEG_4381 [Monoraphidium neglectum]|uniref:DUF5666 domain-containing protein n=1 Tax=Monoraphidium neglectum TaxID=145388 RepID=A0A0D2NEC8_9CHLO|nr:hypothetical protein MNEG_4381 [Monoraphidium neglectum]KIZ03576.1 hypothetical protein MNEG_4381 [Monoraphidium neglectum]|eukprot:XP_013902595.1 hypothetical protein MNEG_4381 [Monoraphidium neglectum]
MAQAARSALAFLVLGLIVIGAHAAVNTVHLSQTAAADNVKQNVNLRSKADRVEGDITLQGTATDNLNQRIHVIAPGRTNTEGLTLSATGTGGTVKRQIICSGGGELRPHDD